MNSLSRTYGTYILTASSATERAEEREKDGHGVFTKALLDCLSEAGKETITINDLYSYTFERLARNSQQTPRLTILEQVGEPIEIGNYRAKHERERREARGQLMATARVRFDSLLAAKALTQGQAATLFRLFEGDEATLVDYERPVRANLIRYLNDEIDFASILQSVRQIDDPLPPRGADLPRPDKYSQPPKPPHQPQIVPPLTPPNVDPPTPPPGVGTPLGLSGNLAGNEGAKGIDAPTRPKKPFPFIPHSAAGVLYRCRGLALVGLVSGLIAMTYDSNNSRYNSYDYTWSHPALGYARIALVAGVIFSAIAIRSYFKIDPRSKLHLRALRFAFIFGCLSGLFLYITYTANAFTK